MQKYALQSGSVIISWLYKSCFNRKFTTDKGSKKCQSYMVNALSVPKIEGPQPLDNEKVSHSK